MSNQKTWRVPWTEVRYGTEYEKRDNEWNQDWAEALTDGNLDLWQQIIAAASDDPGERLVQGIAVMDDVLIAYDMLGWKLVPKDDSTHRYPILRNDDFRPDWCEKG
jgi:hypothetical protein